MTEALQEEATLRHKDQLRLFQNAILIVLGHPDSEVRDSIVAEIAHDLDAKYFSEEITMQERIDLLHLLNGES